MNSRDELLATIALLQNARNQSELEKGTKAVADAMLSVLMDQRFSFGSPVHLSIALYFKPHDGITSFPLQAVA
jgi:hypothetical protein